MGKRATIPKGLAGQFEHRAALERAARTAPRAPAAPPAPTAAAVTVRRARVEDYEGIARVLRRTIPATYGGLMPRQRIAAIIQRFTPSAHEQTVRWLGGGCFVAEAGGEIVGYALACVSPTTGEPEFSHQYVLPDYQGRGVGAALTAARREYLRSRGYRHAYATILSTNTRARRFHERRGAVVVAERPGGGIVELVYHIPLEDDGLDGREGPDDAAGAA